MEDQNPLVERLHAHIEGHVQGVGFRAFVDHHARQLNLKGWVRNRWDGSVEVVVEGDRIVLEQLLALLRNGPRGANVTNLVFGWQPASGEFVSFSVRRTD